MSPLSADFTSGYRPDPRHTRLGDAFYDVVAPAAFPARVTRFRNQRWAERLGLGALSDEDWTRHFGAFEPLPENLTVPLALRYHGHQFRSYNPNLGDGRGFLFAQLRDAEGRLLDLATKGSGQTPWSRAGDGRLTLKGGVREALATEMLEALGVNTSKTLSLIETGEALMRNDEPSPTRAAVLTRLSHSHVRIGTFQRLLATDDKVNMRRLIDYSIETYWPEAAPAADPVAAFYRLTVEAVAKMAAQWFAAGFVHGVLNTDNTVITGESFDYGPWRFLPTLDPAFTAAYFDDTGLYAFGRQPGAMAWNLARLGECLLGFSSLAVIEAELSEFRPAFDAALTRQTCARLALPVADEAKAAAASAAFYHALHESKLPFERAFFDMTGGARPERLAASPHRADYEGAVWAGAVAVLRAAGSDADLSAGYFQRAAPVTMLIEDVEAVWDPIARDDDWSRFEAAVAAVREMGAAYAPFSQVQSSTILPLSPARMMSKPD